jgi:multiple antibiotic resistance protein
MNEWERGWGRNLYSTACRLLACILISMWLSVTLQILRSCLVILTALFPVVNPLGNTPIFLSLTTGFSTQGRVLLSRKIALNSFWLLTGSMLIGSHVLDFFGLSIPVVQVGGGLVVAATGWRLLNRDVEESRSEQRRKISSRDIANRAFYPLTLPLTVGPGSISVALTLGANQAPHAGPVRLTAAIIGPALVSATIFLSYRFAEGIARVLGETAMNVIVRLTSFILLCIGVAIVWDGAGSLLRTVPSLVH